jgi:hypothetical protein
MLLPSRAIIALLILALMLVEYLFHRLNDVDIYDAGETAASLAIAVPNQP